MTVLAIGTAITATTAVERVCAARHWPTDVLAGAALGIGIGAAIGRATSRAPAQARPEAP